jgi:hypothetical protein
MCSILVDIFAGWHGVNSRNVGSHINYAHHHILEVWNEQFIGDDPKLTQSQKSVRKGRLQVFDVIKDLLRIDPVDEKATSSFFKIF